MCGSLLCVLGALAAGCGGGPEQDGARDDVSPSSLHPATHTSTPPSVGNGTVSIGVPDDASEATDGSAVVTDGPVLRRKITTDTIDELMALVEGTLELSDECLFLASDTSPERRYPIIWPARAAWDPDRRVVALSPTNQLQVGDRITAGGGFLSIDDVEAITSDVDADRAVACLDNDTGEIAVLNSEDGSIQVSSP